MYWDYFNETNLRAVSFLVGDVKVPAEDSTDTNHYSVKPKPLLSVSLRYLFLSDVTFPSLCPCRYQCWHQLDNPTLTYSDLRVHLITNNPSLTA